MRLLEAIRNAFTTVLDVILPRKERAMRTVSRTLEDLPLLPSLHELRGVRITTLMDYNVGAVEDTIRTLKYDGTREAAKLLASALADYLREEMASIKAFSPRPIILVPVPLHPSRVHERGFNQMERVLENLPGEFRNGSLARLSPGGLLRTRATKQQTRLSRQERLKNVVGAFAADRKAVRGTHCILIDDVTTTGATLSECAKALESAGSVVTAIALARA